MLGALDQILAEVAALRDAGALEVMTMGQLADASAASAPTGAAGAAGGPAALPGTRS
jgi:hypothetical protein